MSRGNQKFRMLHVDVLVQHFRLHLAFSISTVEKGRALDLCYSSPKKNGGPCTCMYFFSLVTVKWSPGSADALAPHVAAEQRCLGALRARAVTFWLSANVVRLRLQRRRHERVLAAQHHRAQRVQGAQLTEALDHLAATSVTNVLPTTFYSSISTTYFNVATCL